MKQRLNGFTLIELLVAISIITILASILFPVFAQARQAAHKTVCLSNQKQLGLAVLMYTDDADGVFPGYVQDTWYRQGNATPIWCGMIQPYLKSTGVFTCPRATSETRYGGTWGERGWPSLGLNTNFGLWIWGGVPVRVSQSAMDKPAKNVLLSDSTSGAAAMGYRGYIVNAWNPREGQCGIPTVINGTGATLSDRHQVGSNVTLADGHANWKRIETIIPGEAPRVTDWCQCVVDANPARFKWLVHYTCNSD